MSLGDSVALLAGVNDEQCAGQLLHLLDAAEILLQLLDLAHVLDDFLLGQHIESAVGLHGLELVQTIHAGTHGLEVGHHTAQPTSVDIVLTAAGSLVTDGVLSLLLGADEQDALAVLAELTDEVISLFQLLHGLLQIDDVDAVTLGVDVGSHLGVPATGLMTEVHACLQQGLHGYDVCHSVCFSFFHLVLYLQAHRSAG